MGARRPAWHVPVAALRRRMVRSGWMDAHLPWPLWCALAGADAIAVAWVLARRAGRPLRFVQIGSNDGVVHDPIHVVVRTYGWTGVLVEPIPELFEKLKANYADVPGLAFENAAVGDRDGCSRLYGVRARAGDPYWVDQLSSFDRSTVLSHAAVLEDLESRIVEIPVETLTLPSLVRRHDLTSVDLLHVDVEGFDFEVLRQIDFAAEWAPRFVIFERQHLDRATDARARRMLRHAGYRCVDIWPDMLAYRCSPGELASS